MKCSRLKFRFTHSIWIFFVYTLPRYNQRYQTYSNDYWQLQFHIPKWFILIRTSSFKKYAKFSRQTIN